MLVMFGKQNNAYRISLDGDVLEEVVVGLYDIFAVVEGEGLAVDEFVEVRLLDLGQ